MIRNKKTSKVTKLKPKTKQMPKLKTVREKEAFKIKKTIFAETIAMYLYRILSFTLVRFNDVEEESVTVITVHYLYRGKEYREESKFDFEILYGLDEKGIVDFAYETTENFIRTIFGVMMISE